MKKSIATILIICIAVLNPAYSADQKSTILASKHGLNLTQEHLDMAARADIEFGSKSALSAAELEELKLSLIQEFNADPQGTIDLTIEMYTEIEPTYSSKTSIPKTPITSNQTTPNSEVAVGHMQLRQSVRSLSQQPEAKTAFPDTAFNTSSVNQLRKFIVNSQLTSSNYNDYSSSKRVYTFCADGTFFYYYGSSSRAAPTFGSGEVTRTDEDKAKGYWDTYQEKGNDVILLFSTDPDFLDESMNNTGLLPMPIAAYQQDVIQLGQKGQSPTPDMLLSRQAIGGCY